jgi:hypothetical protein
MAITVPILALIDSDLIFEEDREALADALQAAADRVRSLTGLESRDE